MFSYPTRTLLPPTRTLLPPTRTLLPLPHPERPGYGSAMRSRGQSSNGISRTGLIGTLALFAVMAFVVGQSLVAGSVTCEICVEHRGRSQCRTVSGASEEEATMAAIVNACAFISGGVTDSMACQRATPTSKNCE
jgi:hypothetical protein